MCGCKVMPVRIGMLPDHADPPRLTPAVTDQSQWNQNLRWRRRAVAQNGTEKQVLYAHKKQVVSCDAMCLEHLTLCDNGDF